jgi:hypothetical protein
VKIFRRVKMGFPSQTSIMMGTNNLLPAVNVLGKHAPNKVLPDECELKNMFPNSIY